MVPGRTPSSSVTTTGSPLRCGISTGTISSSKRPSFMAAAASSWLRAANSSCSSRVMPSLLAVRLGALAHRHLVERAEQPSWTSRRPGWRCRTGSRRGARQHVRRVGHRLHAAGHHDLGLAGPDQLVGERDGVQARQADLVDGQRRHGHRDAALDGGLARGDLALARLDDVTHDHLVDLVAADPGALERRRDGDAAEVHGGEALEGARQLADRGARAGDDDGGLSERDRSSRQRQQFLRDSAPRVRAAGLRATAAPLSPV